MDYFLGIENRNGLSDLERLAKQEKMNCASQLRNGQVLNQSTSQPRQTQSNSNSSWRL